MDRVCFAALLYNPPTNVSAATKQGAIVGGQTSCKEIEMAAFEKYLPEDVQIISCHSLHGPKVDPKGQPLALIKHRASQQSFALVERILSCFNSKVVYLTAQQHDRITADTQAVTHAAFLSMGTAWFSNNQFPWEINRYVGGIENIKCNIMLRIYSNKWHVYAGLAILNNWAKKQIRQYAESVTELFKLMLGGHREELEKRIKTAGAAVFGSEPDNGDLLLRDEVLDRFSLGNVPQERTPNNHLSLLAMVDCWWKLGIVPYDHMICSTPVSDDYYNSVPPNLGINFCLCSLSDYGSESPNIFSVSHISSKKSSTLLLKITLFARMIWNSRLLLADGRTVSPSAILRLTRIASNVSPNILSLGSQKQRA